MQIGRVGYSFKIRRGAEPRQWSPAIFGFAVKPRDLDFDDDWK
jgi:hypothetical protein